MSHISRRTFIQSLVLVPVGLAFGFTRKVVAAAKKTVTTTAEKAKAAIVDVKRAEGKEAKMADTMARALKYVHKSEKADQKCANCMQFSQAVDAAGKDIFVDIQGVGKQRVGACTLFDTGKGYVSADGYCMSWFKAPA